MISTSITPTALSEVVARCRRQQQAWARATVRQRLRPVRAFRRLVVEEADALCAAAERDIGKPAAETLACELLPLAAACKFLEREAPRLLRPRRVPGRLRPLWLWPESDVVYRRPRGLVGIIGTWNYPLILNGVQILQAATAGNGVLWKPSEVAPATAEILYDLVRRGGFPADLIQLLPPTREAGQQLSEADIDHVVFTGSSATGKRLAETLARRLITSTLELSGCDPMFVLEDADVGLAARAAWFGCTLNRGQTCIAVRRAFVHRSLYPAFLDALRPLAAGATPVRLALSSQVEQAERLVQAALAEGARLLTDAPAEADGDARAFRPTVVVDAMPEMAQCREASFAPLLAVLPFDSLEDAVRKNAVCPYGLGASIFSRNPAAVNQLATSIRAGSLVVNDVIVSTAHPATPFGGEGASGWGVTQGAEGLLDLTVPQAVSVRGGSFRPHYEPAGSAKGLPEEALRGMLQWSHAATFGQRCRGFFRMIRGWIPK
jgi:acyl-CoA reductase-like NAD-dependent aldehyde dehydrogenase